MLSVAAVELFTGFRKANSGTCGGFQGSGPSARCPLEFARALTVESVSLPLVVMGDDCLLGVLMGAGASEFPFMVRGTPGRDLPAETGLSGKVVLRFGGVSREKSGGTTGCGGGRIRGPGELGRDVGAELRPFD